MKRARWYRGWMILEGGTCWPWWKRLLQWICGDYKAMRSRRLDRW